MRTVSLGATGLPVTPVGLGLAALGRPGYINIGHAADLGRDRSVTAMERHAHGVLDAAYAAGVRYFDAARSYGRAEEFLAAWLRARDLAPGDVTVGSKWGYRYTANWSPDAEVHEIKDHSVDALRRQYGESRAHLGAHLDLYQIHSATPDSGVLHDRSVTDVLMTLRERGLAIGLTVSGPRQAEVIHKALDIEVDGVSLFQSVQATWNVLETSTTNALATAHDAGWGVIVKEALANGRLTPRNQEKVSAGTHTLLENIATRRGTSIDALALGAALAQPWAHVVLSGATRVGQLEANVTALSVSLTTDDLSELARVAESPDDYWAMRARLPWN